MRLNKVKILNFCQHEKLEHDFGPGVIGIMGSNGVGKSNYLKAIKYGFVGSSGNAGKKEEDLRWGAEKGSVALGFEVKGTTGVVKRDIKTTRCGMKFGTTECKTATEIDQVIYEILGTSSKVLSELVFVPQGQIEGILFQKASERAKSFQILFGTENAEYIKDLMHEDLNRSVVETKVDAILQVESQLKNNVLEPLEKSKAAYAEMEKGLLSPEYRAAWQQVVSQYANYTRHKTAYDQASAALVTSKTALDSATAMHTSEQALIETLATTLVNFKEDANAAYARRANRQMLKSADENRSRLQANIEVHKKIMASPPPVCTVDQARLEDSRKKFYALQADLFLSEKVSKIDPNMALCPTCGQPITPDHINSHGMQVVELRSAMAPLQNDIVWMEAGIQKYAADLVRHTADVRNADQALFRDTTTLAGLPSGTTFTREQEVADEKIIEVFTDVQNSLDSLRRSSAGHQSAMAAAAATFEAARSRVAEEKAAMGTEVTLKEYNDAMGALDRDKTQVIKAAEVSGAIKNLEAQKVNLEKQLEELRTSEARNRPLLGWRERLERGKLLLHRDGLPKVVAQEYLHGINYKLAQYLELFDVPFTATIDHDLNINCLFGNNKTVSAERLSGGQKSMLGVSFRFAVHEMFASSLGLLVLDEPTAYLDDDHIDCMFKLLEKVKGYSKNAGLQLLVVTHEQRLQGVFDGVIRI